MPIMSPDQTEEDVRPSHVLNSRLSNFNHFAPTSSGGLGASQVANDSHAPRPSMMASLLRPSSMMRSTVVTDLSNNFSESKLQDARVQIFKTDVLMEGQLLKKGESGLQSWKNRIFVLRGQELSYYTIDSKQRYGAIKGAWDISGATVDRQDNSSFCLKLANGSTRNLAAVSVHVLMDWMTAIAVAAEARVIAPSSNLSLVDQSRSTHVIFVRHGHYNTSPTPSTDLRGPLTELGVQQARATGTFLYKYLSDRMVLKRYPTFPIYHSGIRRAVETAQTIGDAFPTGKVRFGENKLYREAWPGNPLPNSNRQQLAREKLDNMVSDCARLKMAYRMMFRHLIPQDLEVDERELSEEDQKLYASTFGVHSTQTRPKDRFRVVVCHANVIRWFVCKALGVDPDGTWGRMRYNHCGITAMDIDSVGNVQLTYMNQTGHLETAQLTEV
ncbi:hypothetical protein CCR75_008959 [Bremia lactucae]|uniref:Serine/threonine-protein phosphatase PGAM5, mitochondrial n=1 Tax=Bremia lactucae TaxID=4779 RepID=A0A976FM87_BRELC|nr:hypothetical protein CCR75_008959 [Bremia lactucae]